MCILTALKSASYIFNPVVPEYCFSLLKKHQKAANLALQTNFPARKGYLQYFEQESNNRVYKRVKSECDIRGYLAKTVFPPPNACLFPLTASPLLSHVTEAAAFLSHRPGLDQHTSRIMAAWEHCSQTLLMVMVMTDIYFFITPPSTVL